MKFYSSKKESQAGFTLIELLIVSAIIAMLAAVVLTSLQRARKSARDAAAKGQVSVMRTEAEVEFMANNNSYANVCTNAGIVASKVKLDKDANGASTCTAAAGTYVIYFTLNTDSTKAYCVDNTGYAGERALSGLSTASTACLP